MTKDLLLLLLEQAVSELDATFAAVADDKLLWKPLDNGRSALDLYADAAQSFDMVKKFVTSGGAYQPSAETMEELEAARTGWTRDTATALMQREAASFRSAVETFSEEQLAAPLTLSMDEDITMPCGAWIMMAYRHCLSRFAQINYIQTLYGDFDPH